MSLKILINHGVVDLKSQHVQLNAGTILYYTLFNLFFESGKHY